MFLDPDSGPPGSRFTARGNGFLAGEQIELTWDGAVVNTVVATANGAFASELTVPGNAAPAQHSVGARGRQSGSQAAASYRVTPAPTSAPPTTATATTTTAPRPTTTARATTTTTRATTTTAPVVGTSEPPEIDPDPDGDEGDDVDGIGDADDAVVGQTEGGDDDGNGGLVALIVLGIIAVIGGAVAVGVAMARQREAGAGPPGP